MPTARPARPDEFLPGRATAKGLPLVVKLSHLCNMREPILSGSIAAAASSDRHLSVTQDTGGRRSQRQDAADLVLTLP
jgi:hypothetical protein